MANGSDQQQNITADQAVALMQYAYPGQSQGWYDIFKNNPSLALGATFGGQSTQSANYGSQGLTGGSTGGQSTTGLANLLRAFGGGGQQQQQQQAPSTQQVPVSQDPINAMTNLGAAALGAAGFSGPQGAYAVYNPTPGQITSAKGGVSNVPSPVSSNAIPQAAMPGVASVFGGQQEAQGAQVYKSYGGDPNAVSPSVLRDFYNMAVEQGKIRPGGPTQGGTPTPVTPANAAAASGASTGAPTPWATAPAAPGITPPTIPQLSFGAAHTSALADAGKALYAHFGGDPDSATPGDIANFHTQLTGTIGQYTAGANPSPNIIGTRPTPPAGGPAPGVGGIPTFGSAPTPPPAAAPPKRMAAGGFVTADQDDNTDYWKDYLKQSGGQQKTSQAQPPANLLGTRPSGSIPPPNPVGPPPGMSTVGLPAFGSAYGTPPPLTLPPWQGQQGAAANQGALPPANIIGTRPTPPAGGPNPVGPPPGMSTVGLPAFGAPPGTPPPLTLPPWQGTKQMAYGGFVPGRGNQDTVPALLTPGEYVIPKEQAAQLFGGRTPIRMQSGGTVPDEEKQPSETRHQTLTTPTAANQPGGGATATNQPTTATSSTPPAAPGTPDTSWAQRIAQNAQNRAALTSGGASGGGYNVPGSVGGYIGASPGPGQTGYWYPNQAAATAAGDVGTGVKGVGPSAGQISGAIGGLASGLSAAAKTYADSIKPWQMQQSAIPAPPPAPAVPQLKQQQLPQPQQRMSGAQYGYNPYPTY